MPAPKGSYNARKYHAEVAEQTATRLASVLQALTRSGVVFKSVSALSAYASERTGQTAGNLRRNRIYRGMLESHLTRQKEVVSRPGMNLREVADLRVQLLKADLLASNATRDKKRYERLLHELEGARFPRSSTAAVDPKPTTSEDRRAFECTAQALLLLIEKLDFIEIDLATKTLFDRSARPGNQLIVGANYLDDFCSWLRRRPNIPDGLDW